MAAYLYGSYGTAAQTPLSDVDLALLFADGHVPSHEEHVELIGLVTGTLREDDVSATVLNRTPLAFQHRVLARGRLLLLTDEIAHADFVERTIIRYYAFATDDGAVPRGVRSRPDRGVRPWRRLTATRCGPTSTLSAATSVGRPFADTSRTWLASAASGRTRGCGRWTTRLEVKRC